MFSPICGSQVQLEEITIAFAKNLALGNILVVQRKNPIWFKGFLKIMMYLSYGGMDVGEITPTPPPPNAGERCSPHPLLQTRELGHLLTSCSAQKKQALLFA